MYKIPTDDEIALALKNVMAKRRTVYSQRRLKALVEKELQDMDPNYRIGAVRLRLFAINLNIANVEIRYRKTKTKKVLNRCPVCRGKLKRIRSQTVFDGTVTVGYECTRCPYRTGLERKVPNKYIFTRKK